MLKSRNYPAAHHLLRHRLLMYEAVHFAGLFLADEALLNSYVT